MGGYAIDEDGIDGWVPSNYLDRCSEEEQISLKEEHRKQAEEEAAKQAELAAAGAYDIAPDQELDAFDDDDDEKGAGSNKMRLELMKRANNFRSRQEAKAKGDDATFDKLEQERVARKKQNALNNQYKGRGANKSKAKNKVNKAVNKQWKSDDEIAKEK